jgi:pre-mRNA-splicing factor RBM22/SLT11
VGGLTPEVGEADIRDQFYHFGELTSVRVVETKFCAFVTFASREAAEKAVEEMQNKLIVKGARLKLLWGKPQQQREEGGGGGAGGAPGRPAMLPPQVAAQVGGAVPMGSGNNFFGLPQHQHQHQHQQQQQQQQQRAFYPSMDPSAMGTRVPAPGEQRKQGGGAADGQPESKRQRGEGPGPQSSGYGAPLGAYGMRPPMGMMMPPMPMMPPGGFRMPMGGQPPPMGMMRPPMGPPPQQQQQPPALQQPPAQQQQPPAQQQQPPAQQQQQPAQQQQQQGPA